MSTYQSQPVVVDRPIDEVRQRLSDFTVIKDLYDQAPADIRQQAGELDFTRDTITINTPQMGAVTLEATERTPERIVLQAIASPVPLSIIIAFQPLDGGARTQVTTAMDVEIPAMLRPFVAPKMQQAADQMCKMMANLANQAPQAPLDAEQA